LRRIDCSAVRLVAVSDSRGTLFSPRGLDPTRAADVKERTGFVSATRSVLDLPTLETIGADIVVDATATLPGREGWYDLLQTGVLERGAHLILAAKDALCSRVDRWADTHRDRVRYNAVLGGAGDRLRAELDELRTSVRSVSVAGNATTTTIIGAVEAGGSLDDGIDAARRAELLEADPELDFRGFDAALKLAIVAGALLGRPIAPSSVPAEDIRNLNLDEVRARPPRGATTRLVGRLDTAGSLAVRYEEVPHAHPLDVPVDRVAYLYHTRSGGARLHVGDGLGAERTAASALLDVGAVAGLLSDHREVAR
jgi:homoserine dehydrogenase